MLLKAFKSLILALSFTTISYSQDDLFPMKGNYIYYDFEEETSNTKHCIKHYSSSLDSTGQINSSAGELALAVQQKCKNLNELKVTLVGLKNTQVMIRFTPSMTKGCTGEISTPTGLMLILPTGTQLLEDNLLFSLVTIGKFKVSSQSISATIKVVFKSNNKYSLTFSNFQITYSGTQGSKYVTEVVNLEDVYKSLRSDPNNRMYDKGMKSMKEIDDLVRGCARIYSQELKRVYEIDEL